MPIDWTEDPSKVELLRAWFENHIPEWQGSAFQVVRLNGGSSSATYRVDGASFRAVLRMPQTPPRQDSLRALARESRVLKALAGTNVPHARWLAYCEEDSPVGSPFLVSRFVDGWSGADSPPLGFADVAYGRQLAFSLIDALLILHELDYRALGLEGFGRPEGFLARQVDQWTNLFTKHRSDPNKPSRDLPGVSMLGDWLRANMADDGDAALVHCDASFSNVIFASDAPPRVAAIIDWEIATIGTPLIDLGRAVYPFPDARGLPGVSMMKDHGQGPTRQELASRYAGRRKADLASLDYFMVLAMFKLAALLESNYARAALGLDTTGMSARVANFVPQLLQGAQAIVDAH